METVAAVVVAVIGSGLIQYLLTRYDDKKGIKTSKRTRCGHSFCCLSCSSRTSSMRF